MPLAAPSRISDLTSSMEMKLAPPASLQPKIHSTALLDTVRVFTKNALIRARNSMGRASSDLICSEKRSARDFGTSSPSTREKYEMGTTTNKIAMASPQRVTQGKGRDSICGFRKPMAAAPPMAEAKELTRVTPICTVAKKRSGSFFKRTTAAADLTPFSKSASMRLLRVAIMAISDAAKKPFARIKIKIKTASNQIFSEIMGCVSYFSSALGPKKTAAVGRGIRERLERGIGKIWRRRRTCAI